MYYFVLEISDLNQDLISELDVEEVNALFLSVCDSLPTFSPIPPIEP